MLSFFRTGDYDSLKAKRFLADFRKSKMDMLQLRPEAYRVMFNALVTQDNLSYVTVKTVQIETYKHVVMMIDNQTSHAAKTFISWTR